MISPSPFRAIFSRIALQPSWAQWQVRTEHTVIAAVVRSDRPAPDAIHAARPRTATLAYMLLDGQVRTESLELPPRNRAEAVVLDAFARLYDLATPSINSPVVFVDHPVVRSELLSVAQSFPRVRLAERPTGCLESLFHLAGAALPDPVITTTATEVTSPSTASEPTRPVVLEIGTDASQRRGHCGVGIGAVDSKGVVHTEYLARVDDINLGELLAIELAVRSHSSSRLKIVTDSQSAAELFQAPMKDIPAWVPSSYDRRIRKTQDRLQRKRSKVVWVPGHSGHPLNEAAHRAAVAARRNAEFGIDADVASAMYQRIGADAAVPLAA